MSSFLASFFGTSETGAPIDKDSSDEQKTKEKQSNEKKETTEYTMEEVRKHNTESDCWMVINNRVYDITNFIEDHPGGDIIMDGAGKDSTDLFHDIGHSRSAQEILDDELWIGVLKKE